MKLIINKIKLFFTKVSNFLPELLPIGLSDYDAWADSIITTYEFPDNDSIRFSLAVMILHLSSTAAYKSKRYFALCLHKGMSNQVVSQVMQDLKAKQEQQLKKSAEATAALVAPADAIQQ